MTKSRCEAVVLRIAPDPISGESLNIGVVLHAPDRAFLGARFPASWTRITSAFPNADAVHLRRVASALVRAAATAYAPQLGLENQPNVVEAVRRIIPENDAAILISSKMSGLTDDPERTLRELFERFVTPPAVIERRAARADIDVWRRVSTDLREHGVLDRLRPHVLRGTFYEENFDTGWKNGHWHVAQPLSLDLLDAHAIVEKAASWSGRLLALEPGRQQTTVVVVVGLPGADAPQSVRQAGADGLGLLRKQLGDEDVVEVTLESEAPTLARRIARDLAHEDVAEE